MSERIEKLIRDYPAKKMQLDCLRHQLASFKGISESEMIDTMQYAQPTGERVSTSNTSDKTATIALNYRQRMERINQEWYEHLADECIRLTEEIRFFESAVRSLKGLPGAVLCDMIWEEMPWDELARKYFVSRTMVGKYRKKAVQDLESLYAHRDEDEIAYMLS